MADKTIDYKKWHDFCERKSEDGYSFLHWVCGGINVYGHVIGHAYWGDDASDGVHTSEESGATSWRWSVREQRFMDYFIPPKRDMTDEEYLRVGEWLLRHGYTDEFVFSEKFLKEPK